jgi:DNA-binding transcriptional LysR family regulator
MVVASLLPEFSFFSLGDFCLLTDLLDAVEKFGESAKLTVLIPDDAMACKAWHEPFSQVFSRYSRFVKILPLEGVELDSLSGEEGVDVFELGLMRRAFANGHYHIGIVRKNANGASRYARLRFDDQLVRIPVATPPLDENKLKELILVWRAHEIAASLRLVLIGGGDAGQVALDLSIEFGFNDVDSLVADGAPSKFLRKRTAAKAGNSRNLCIATSKVGHALVQGLAIRFAGCSTHAALSEVVFDELRSRVTSS